MEHENREAGAAPADEARMADASEFETSTDAGAEAASAEAELQRLEAEKADLTDRLVRLAAEMENLRRRTERDVADARRYAVQKFAGDVLVVGDNLRRALEAAQGVSAADEAMKGFVEGVEMTGRELHRVLERHGVTRIEANGQRFDPHLHQAMFEVPDGSVPAGTVVQTVQDGFRIGDRVLRAALVGVSKGGPKPGADETAA